MQRTRTACVTRSAASWVWCSLLLGWGSTAAAKPVAIDMSSALNYDGVVTSNNQGVALNPNKVLEALRFTATSSGSSRENRVYLYGIVAESASAPPTTLIVLK